jgi:hypothetical protein
MYKNLSLNSSQLKNKIMRSFFPLFLSIVLLLGIASPAFSQKKKLAWPNVEYTYVKAYTFNFQSPKNGVDHGILSRDGKMAKSVVGEPYKITNEKAQQIIETVTENADNTKMLIVGLSKCFLPRHAVVFYNGDKPVAYIDMCFECQAIRLFPRVEIDYDKMKYSEKKEKAALKMMSKLQLFVESVGMPYFDTSKEYVEYGDAQRKKEKVDNNKAVFLFDFNFAKNVFKEKPTQAVIKAMLPDTAFIKEDKNVEISAGGDEYIFPEISYKVSNFMFSNDDPDALLAEASIKNIDIVLMGKYKVGMSVDQFLSNFEYDGPTNPSKVEVGDAQKNQVFSFIFKAGILMEIKIVAYNW